MAKENDVDLVEIAGDASPPVCKLMNYSRFVFEKGKRRAQSKKKQHIIRVKEIKFRPSIGSGDYLVKINKIDSFLLKGDKVRVTLQFRGREMQHKNVGCDLFDRIKNDLNDVSVEQDVKLDGRQVTMLLSRK